MIKKEVIVPPNLEPYFSNAINIAFKDDEFTLLFMHEIPNDPKVRARAVVTITPQHAKRFYDMFGKVIADYEKKFGMINGHMEDDPKKEKPTGYA